MQKRVLIAVCAASALLVGGRAAAWTIEGTTATLAAGETVTVSSPDDLNGVSRIYCGDADSRLVFADGIELTDRLEVGGNGGSSFATAVLHGGYCGYAASPSLYFRDGGTLTVHEELNGANGNGWVQLKNGGNGGGTLVLATEKSAFARLRFVSAVGIRCGATDVLWSADGVGAISFNGTTGNGPGIDLDGYSQRVRSLDAGDIGESAAQTGVALVKSAAPATFELCGVLKDGAGYPFRFSGAVSFCWNGTGSFDLIYAASDTTGDLVVSNGTLGIAKNATWGGKNVVVSNGTLRVDSSDPFTADDVRLVVGANGSLALNADVTVAHATIDGADLLPGEYLAGDFASGHVTGQGLLTVSGQETAEVSTHVWTGAAGNALASDGNWKEGVAPDFTDGGARLVFSDGSAQAVASGQLRAYSIEIRTNANFTLSAADGARIDLGGRISASNAPSTGTPLEHTVSAPLRILSTATEEWSVGAETTLRLAGPIDGAGAGTIPVTGEGTVVLDGENGALVRPLAFYVKNLEIGSSTALGSPDRAVTVGSNTLLTVSCPTNDVPLYFDLGQYHDGTKTVNRTSWLDESLDSFVQNGLLTIKSGSYFDLTSFFANGGFRIDGGNLQLYVFNGGTGAVRGPLKQTGGVYVRVAVSGTVYLGMTACDCPAVNIRDYSDGNASVAVCERAGVFSAGVPLLLGNGPASPAATLDLNGFDQAVGSLSHLLYGKSESVARDAAKYATVTSALPATLTVAGRPNYYIGTVKTDFTATNSVAFRGSAGLTYAPSGAYEMRLVNMTSETKGALTVSAGRLALDWDARWIGSTNVSVTGGTLEIAAEAGADPFGPDSRRNETVLTLAGDGTLDVAAGKTVAVQALSVGGTFVAPGLYGSAQALAAGAVDAAHVLPSLAGAGVVKVRQPRPGPLPYFHLFVR